MPNNAKQHIFFVDDEPKIREVVSETIEQLGVKVSCFACAADCLEQLGFQRCDLLITDVKMPEMDGMELLAKAKRLAPWMPILVITGYGDIPMAVTAIKAGAVDFIEKPLDKKSFLWKVKSILQQNTFDDSYFYCLTLLKIYKSFIRLTFQGNSPHGKAERWNDDLRYKNKKSLKKLISSHRFSMVW